MKILAVFDGKPASVAALKTAAVLADRLKAELGVVTVRSGTHATESLPPIGWDIPAEDRDQLPDGIRVLLRAADLLVEAGLMRPLASIRLRDLPHGHLFAAERTSGEPVFFAERFGSLIDELNREVDERGHDLVVIAAPRRGALGRFAPMNIPRKLALDLNCSFMVVRGGSADSRLLVCADGSPSSRRIFPFLKRLLPGRPRPHRADLRPPRVSRSRTTWRRRTTAWRWRARGWGAAGRRSPSPSRAGRRATS